VAVSELVAVREEEWESVLESVAQEVLVMH